MDYKKIVSSVVATSFLMSNIPMAIKNTSAADMAKKPNIIHILVDDMGFMDTSLNGSEYYETPNIQRLAKQGMTFTNSYACPLCSPSRAAILTGQYAHRLYFTTPGGHTKDNNDGFTPKFPVGAAWQETTQSRSRTAIPSENRLIAQDFKDEGYTTGIIGKHHVGLDDKYQMGNRGFDWDMAVPNPGPPSHYAPFNMSKFDKGAYEDEYITDRIAREAADWIAKNKDKPFFLDFWQFQLHAPFQAKKEYVEYFKNKVDPRGEQNGRYIMAAMVKSMDDAIGVLMDKLEKEGISDNTVIVVSGDNGGVVHDVVNGQTATNNYPLRQGKASIYEGGIRVPTVIKWPGVTKPASVCNENISVVDFYPTFLDIIGKKPQEGQILDGLSLVPLLKGEKNKLDRPGVVTHFNHVLEATGNINATAVNVGDWKLIRNYLTLKGKKQKYELYNLKENISETVNLADKFPEKVKELEAFMDQNLKDTNADFGRKNSKFDADAPLPAGYENYWFKLWDELEKKVANDPTVKDYPKVVYENEDSKIDNKLQGTVTLKIDSPDALISSSTARVDAANKSVKPIIENGRTLVPIRFIAESLGASVGWDSNTSMATLTLKDRVVSIKNGENKMLVNGKEVMLDVAAVTKNYPVPKITSVPDEKANNPIVLNKPTKAYDSGKYTEDNNFWKEPYLSKVAVDGVIGNSNRWVSKEDAKAPQYFEIDLGANYQITGFDIFTTAGYPVKSFKLQYKDGSDWKDVVGSETESDIKTGKLSATFEKVETNALRFVYSGDGYVRVLEFLVKGNEYVNGEWKDVNSFVTGDEKAQNTYSRMLLPLRAVAEAFGKQVYWNKDGIINISDDMSIMDDAKVLDKVNNLFKSFLMSDKSDWDQKGKGHQVIQSSGGDSGDKIEE